MVGISEGRKLAMLIATSQHRFFYPLLSAPAAERAGGEERGGGKRCFDPGPAGGGGKRDGTNKEREGGRGETRFSHGAAT